MTKYLLVFLLRCMLIGAAVLLFRMIMHMNQISLSLFIDPSSALYILVAACYLPVAFAPRDLGHAFLDAIMPPDPQVQSRYALSAYVWSSAGRYQIAFGLIGFFLGVVQAMGNLDDQAALGAAIALALLPLFYTLLPTVLICLPISLRLQAQTVAGTVQAEGH